MPRSFARRLLTAGIAVAIVDFCWAVFLTVMNDRPAMSVWNGVASTVFGAEMNRAGMTGVAIGLVMHVMVAFSWSALFILIESNVAAVRRLVSKPGGELAVAAVYGPIVWATMSLVVIPTLTGNPPRVTARWFMQLAGHFPFVGVPIVVGARR